MSNGWPVARRARRASQTLQLLMLAVVLVGCARSRQGTLGGSTARPLVPPMTASRPEPGLRVRAPFVDVQLADRDQDKGEPAKGDGSAVKTSREPEAISSRVGLFRSPSSGRSLEATPPLN